MHRCAGGSNDVATLTMLPLSQYAASGLDPVSDSDLYLGLSGQIDVQARPETDQAETLPTPKDVTGLYRADDSSGHQPGDLYKSNPFSGLALEHQGIVLIILGGLVQISRKKFTRMVIDRTDSAFMRRAVHVYVEHGHEYTDPGAGTVKIGRLLYRFYLDDLAVSR